MDEEFKKAYESLIPKDRLVIDVMLGMLVEKDREIHRLSCQLKDLVNKMLGDKE